MKKELLRLSACMFAALLVGTGFTSCNDNDDDAPTYDDVYSVTVSTGDANEVSYVYATVNYAVDVTNPAVKRESCTTGVIYTSATGATEESLVCGADGVVQVNGGVDETSCKLYDLKSSTTYSYRAFAKVNGTYCYGAVKNLTTLDISNCVSVSTGSCDALKCTSARLNLMPAINDKDVTLMRGFEETGVLYTTQSMPAEAMQFNAGGVMHMISDNNLYCTVSGLEVSTSYLYRAYAKIDGVYYYGDINTFTTKDITTAIVVTTGAKDAVTQTSARMKYTVQITEDGVKSLPYTSGVLISTTASTEDALVAGAEGVTQMESTDGRTCTVENTLTPGTTYYYRAYYLWNGKYIYGAVSSLKTQDA